MSSTKECSEKHVYSTVIKNTSDSECNEIFNNFKSLADSKFSTILGKHDTSVFSKSHSDNNVCEIQFKLKLYD